MSGKIGAIIVKMCSQKTSFSSSHFAYIYTRSLPKQLPTWCVIIVENRIDINLIEKWAHLRDVDCRHWYALVWRDELMDHVINCVNRGKTDFDDCNFSNFSPFFMNKYKQTTIKIFSCIHFFRRAAFMHIGNKKNGYNEEQTKSNQINKPQFH